MRATQQLLANLQRSLGGNFTQTSVSDNLHTDFVKEGGIVGAGFEELRWPKPVRPGDELHVESEILDVRISKSRPDQGIVKVRTTTFNQADEPVQVFTGNLIVRRRPAAAAERKES